MKNAKLCKIIGCSLIISISIGMYNLPLSQKDQHICVQEVKQVKYMDIPTIQAKEQIIVSTSINTDFQAKYFYFSIPEAYKANGGIFSDELQEYTQDLCNKYDVSYYVVLAIIERESGYIETKIGDNGKSYGFMQIQKKWHLERMNQLSFNNLLDGKQNIAVGVDYLAELKKLYNGNMQKALMAYNMGPTKADKLIRKGVLYSDYSKCILERSKIIESEVTND